MYKAYLYVFRYKYLICYSRISIRVLDKKSMSDIYVKKCSNNNRFTTMVTQNKIKWDTQSVQKCSEILFISCKTRIGCENCNLLSLIIFHKLDLLESILLCLSIVCM